MHNYRITKYNPKYRDSSGAYQLNEWTSYFDIGKKFENKELTAQEYFRIEDAYVETVLLFMNYTQTDSLIVSALEKSSKIEKNKLYTNELIDTYQHVMVNQLLKKEEVANIVRLTLREDVWCKLENQKMYVHFGYEYYMYIGSNSPITDSLIKQIEKLGLFVENFESPYLEDELHN